MRLAWFTDTLWDINGVARFVRTASAMLAAQGHELRVFASSQASPSAAAHIVNIRPLASIPVPGYPLLKLAFPAHAMMLRAVTDFAPDVIHISTPGPVGLAGRRIGLRLGVPLVGVYHTDFPAYIDQLFENHSCAWLASCAMRRFYAPFHTLLARSADYAHRLESMGFDHHRILRLAPGIETVRFGAQFRDPAIWSQWGISPLSHKALYVGRVSVEKNLPMLARLWREYRTPDADLIIVGDGPYRAQMERELDGCRTHFLGFRHAEELSALYASSDLFLFPSTTDTLGQVVMEAQASGLPALVTNQGGPCEVVRHNETGVVLPVADLPVWGAALRALLSDGSRRARMGSQAANWMRQFDLRPSAEHFWKLHESVHRAVTCRAEPERTRARAPQIPRPARH